MAEVTGNSALAKRFDEYLTQHRMRHTPERAAVLQRVLSTSRPFNIESLRAMLEADSYYVSRATLYNTIELMIDAGIVRRLKLDGNHASYEKVVSNIRIRLMCDECGKVKETRDPNFIAFINTRKFTAFNATGFDLYVTGTCSTCARKLKRMKRLKRNNK